MSDVSVVIAGESSGLAGELGTALRVPHLALAADRLDGGAGELRARGRLVWIHTVPAAAGATATLDLGGLFAEAAVLVRSARLAREVAERSGTPLVFIAVVPARGLLTGAHGAACDMAAAAMDSLMRVEIGPWSNAGHRLVAVVYAGLTGHAPQARRPDEEVVARTPMHELCTLAELADAIRYVGSERASYVTGTSLRVDGGWNAYSWMYPARTI